MDGDTPERFMGMWWSSGLTDGPSYNMAIELPEGTVEKILGYKLTWDDEPVNTDNL